MSARTASTSALVLLMACAHVERNTRTERGPLLRTFERAQVVEGGVTGAVTVAWPTLQVSVRGYDTCRQLTVEEYSEDTITEKTSSATGPALSTGFANLLAAGSLFIASQFVSSAPNVATIDASGHYGPSTRQVVQGWGYVTIGIGVPALVVGVISYLRSGEDVETRRVENIAGQKDKRCNERSIDGPVELHFTGLPQVGSTPATQGTAQFDAAQMPGEVDTVGFYGRPLTLDEASQRALDAFNACVQLSHVDAEVNTLGLAALESRVDLLTQCATVRPEVEKDRATARELLTQKQAPTVSAANVAPAKVSSFDDALTQVDPKLDVTAEHALFTTPEKFEGQGARVTGVLQSRFVKGLAVLQVGARRLAVEAPLENVWSAALTQGQRVEVVGVFAGLQTTAGQKLPLVHAVWARPAY